jgi:hypothetical protein
MRGLDLSSVRSRAQASQTDLALLALAVVGVLFVGSRIWAAREELTRARSERLQFEGQKADVARRLDSLLSGSGPEEAVQSVRARLAAKAPPDELVGLVSSLLPPDVRLVDLTLSYDRSLGLEMRVAARRGAAYDQFLERLHESRKFRSITPGPENRDGEVQASVRAEFNPQ